MVGAWTAHRLALLFLALAASPAQAINAPHTEWDYILPQTWDEDFPACAGRQQSPVDIVPSAATVTSQEVRLSNLVHYYDVSGFNVTNTGHGLQVNNKKMGNITVNSEVYNVLQFHVHFPAEHTWNGKRAAGEMHVVHQKVGKNGTDGLLVIGLFFQLGATNPLLTRLGLPIGAPRTAKANATFNGTLNLMQELGEQLKGDFYHYDGSLTTPPCAETVKWFVLAEPQTLDEAQLLAFKALYSNPANARPVQPLGGRLIIKDSLLGCPTEAGSDWNYVHPQCWALAYPRCGGQRQSPIDLQEAELSEPAGSEKMSALASYSAATGLSVVNTGRTLQVSAPAQGALGHVKLEGKVYEAGQFHFHFPSEHAFHGHLLDGELQIVHRLAGPGGNSSTLVLAVPIEVGGSDSAFFGMLGLPSGAPSSDSRGAMAISHRLDLGELLKASLGGSFWRYDGSDTAPPCSETVSWVVLETPIKISRAQVEAVRQLFKEEEIRRPLQLLNGRPLLKGRTSTAGLSVNTSAMGCPEVPRLLRRRLSEWNYLEPQCWEKAYPQCAGRAQSPIDIKTTEGSFGASGEMNLLHKASYRPMTGKVVINSGHSLQISGAGFGSISIQGSTYTVAQLQLHCPSEHRFDGALLGCELQIMHQRVGANGTDDLLAIAVLFKASDAAKDNPFLAQLGLPFGAPTAGRTMSISGAVDIAGSLSVIGKGFYRYDGSLTMPPCSQSVSWFVVSEPLTVSQRQAEAFQAVFARPANNRPVQLMNGRSVFKNTLPGCYVEYTKRRLQADQPQWGYLLPICWSQHYPSCSGDRQSPINIEPSEVEVRGDGAIQLQHGVLSTRGSDKPQSGSSSILRDTGHFLRLDWAQGGALYNGAWYNTKWVDIHEASEHAVNGSLYDAEVQVMHQKVGSHGDSDLLAIAVLYKRGDPSPFLTSLGLSDVSHPETKASVQLPPSPSVPVALDDELRAALAGGFYMYPGSLTSPPCSETVTWLVMAKPLTASKAQLATLRSIHPDPANNRPLQRRNNRTVVMNGAPRAAPTATMRAQVEAVSMLSVSPAHRNFAGAVGLLSLLLLMPVE